MSNEAVVEENIFKPADSLNDLGYAASQVDIIAHSMGGLLVREYCRQNPSECAQNVRKFITIDTPHAGSELGGLIVETNKTPEASCYNLLSKIENIDGMSIWSDSAREHLEGALTDLAPGSQTLQNFAIDGGIKPWVAIVGTTHIGYQPFIFSHDHELNRLWQGVWWYCDRVPDPTFWDWFGTNPPVFSGENDRIVSRSSQENFSVNRVIVTEVDHSTVLRSQSVVDSVKTLIDR